jgi:hypothetical protein
MQGDIVCLLTAVHPAQAHVWQTALAEEGIESKVVGDYLDAGVGDIPGARAELWVRREDVDRAMSIINAHPVTTTEEEEES